MNFWKSRYTASLEQQVAELKIQLTFKEQQLDTLTQQLVNRLKPGEFIFAGFGKDDDKKKPEKKLPELSNWLRTKARLEDPRVKVSEAEEN